MSRQTLVAVTSHLELEARIGGYEAAAAAAEKIEYAYDALARLLGADRDEIAFVENATRAWDMAFYAIRSQPGDGILTLGADTPATPSPSCSRRQHGVASRSSPTTNSGQLSSWPCIAK